MWLVSLSCPGAESDSGVESENEASATLYRRKRPAPSPAVSPTKTGTSATANAGTKRAAQSPAASLVHPASAAALCSASGHTLVVKCDTVVAENVSKQLLELSAPLNVKMLENGHDPERMVLATYASSAELQAAQTICEGLGAHSLREPRPRIFTVQDEFERNMSCVGWRIVDPPANGGGGLGGSSEGAIGVSTSPTPQSGAAVSGIAAEADRSLCEDTHRRYMTPKGRGELGAGQWILELGAGQCRNELTNCYDPKQKAVRRVEEKSRAISEPCCSYVYVFCSYFKNG